MVGERAWWCGVLWVDVGAVSGRTGMAMRPPGGCESVRLLRVRGGR